MQRKKTTALTRQMQSASKKVKTKKQYEGNTEQVISTGSTLLDLAISGGRIKGGGVPSGILVEIFGPSGAGKTVLLCEIAGDVQRQKGEVMFHDPEARLNKQFARIFDLDTDRISYDTPDTVTAVFSAVRKWEPQDERKINVIATDSLAALSTDLEMGKEEGDKMGMRRAKEFSEELRKTARILKQKNLLMVCSNQVRVNADAGPYGQKYISPGGESIGFYSSLRLRFMKPEKIKQEVAVAGKKVTRVIGVSSNVEVFKSSVWKPYRSAPLIILFDYGIDDIRANLQYIKDFTKNTVYTVDGETMGQSMNEAIKAVEEKDLQKVLKEEVIELWEEIENKFGIARKSKQR